ncbi:MAG TPA: hypothetical protein VNQ90_11045 [Chthoniobacteraceae bacterium]|nr:hypothetical protein [Chthoniobacteraceae bacterium]
MDLSDPATAWRLVSALALAGVALLALEIFWSGMAFGVFGGLCALGSTGLAAYFLGIDIGSLFLLGFTTLVSVGFLVLLAYFPNLPLSRGWLQRTARQMELEEAAEREKEAGEGEEMTGGRGESKK